jgi:hypothetical protein
MTSDLASDVASLSAEVERLRAAQVRAEAAAEAAQGEYDRALAKLAEEFGVASVEEASALLTELEAEVTSHLETARSQLAKANGVTS